MRDPWVLTIERSGAADTPDPAQSGVACPRCGGAMARECKRKRDEKRFGRPVEVKELTDAYGFWPDPGRPGEFFYTVRRTNEYGTPYRSNL